MNAVSIYFAWNWHERYEGNFKFAGWHDVDEFLRLCEKHGLYVIARPGPYICSEWDFGGLPNWLIGRDVLLRSLDEKFIVYTLRYYDHIVPTIRKHLATIFLNGRFIGFVKQNGRFELNRGILQDGENEIMMLVESTGHRNDGLMPLANGLNEPVFLGKEMAVQLSGPLFKAIRV